MFPPIPNIPIQEIKNELLSKNQVELYIKREDLIHPEISGNKWRKLKYNVNAYFKNGCQSLVTFGGAFSNHIAATAAAGASLNISTFGIIRGEEVENATLNKAKANGMQFCFVSREEYKQKENGAKAKAFINSLNKPFVVPEGGANDYGLKGCQEIIEEEKFDIVSCACGTGNTLSGIVSKLNSTQYAIGFPVLKGGDFLIQEVNSNLRKLGLSNENWELNLNYHFGGYAKYKSELLTFIQQFWEGYQIKLDPIYTGKALFGLLDLVEKGKITNKRILFIHTGGLQGIEGFEKRYKVKLF